MGRDVRKQRMCKDESHYRLNHVKGLFPIDIANMSLFFVDAAASYILFL